MSMVFDKLGFMRHLESEGPFARPQAEKLSEAFHQAVQETVATTADIQRVEARIDSMDAKFSAVDTKLAGVDTRLAGVDTRLAVVDARLAGVDARITSLEAKLDVSFANLSAAIANGKMWAVGTGVALFSALSTIRFFAH